MARTAERTARARWWDRDERGLLATAVLLHVHEGGRIRRHARRHCLPDAMSRFAASLIPLPLLKLPLLVRVRMRVCVCVCVCIQLINAFELLLIVIGNSLA